MNIISELQEWYLSQCNGDWEHEFGVKINTLDNPGWMLDIDLEGTDLKGKPFSEYGYGVGEDAKDGDDDWLLCKVEDDQFRADGGPRKLQEMIEVFLTWARS